MINIEDAHKRWKTEYEKIESEIELFRIGRIFTKKCKCENIECPHYEKEIGILFKDRLKRLLKAKILIGALADSMHVSRS